MAKQPGDFEKQALLEEWKNTLADIRHFGGKRTLLFTLAVAVNGYLIGAYADAGPLDGSPSESSTWSEHVRTVVSVVGVGGNLVLLMLDVANHRYVRYFLRYGRRLEDRLGVVRQLSEALPPRRWYHLFMTSTAWTMVLLGGGATGWFVLLVVDPA